MNPDTSWKNGLVCNRYASYPDYIEHLDSMPHNKGSRADAARFCAWSGLMRYEEALTCGRGKGDPILGAQISKLVESFDLDSMLTSGAPRWNPAIVGAAPIVPNCLMGLPESMLAREFTFEKSESSPVTVIFERSMASGATAKDAVTYASHVLAIALLLQRVRPVNIALVSCLGTSRGDIKVAASIVDIDLATIDPAQLAFVMAHPAAHRILNFVYYSKVIGGKDCAPLAWGLKRENPERHKRIVELVNPAADFLFFNGLGLATRGELGHDPKAWIMEKAKPFIPSEYLA